MNIMDNIPKYAKGIIYAGLLAPSLYILFGMWQAEGFLSNIWLPIGIAAIALLVFNDNFTSNAEIRHQRQVGPKEPYLPPNTERWQYDLDESGRYVPKKSYVPPRATEFGEPPRYGQYRRGE